MVLKRFPHVMHLVYYFERGCMCRVHCGSDCSDPDWNLRPSNPLLINIHEAETDGGSGGRDGSDGMKLGQLSCRKHALPQEVHTQHLSCTVTRTCRWRTQYEASAIFHSHLFSTCQSHLSPRLISAQSVQTLKTRTEQGLFCLPFAILLNDAEVFLLFEILF